jgi:hypothetical protein
MLTTKLVLASAFACAAIQGAAQAPTMTCPATITVRESATPVAGWTSDARQASRKLARISILNKDAQSREYELAPDDEKQAGKNITQSWKLKDYRTMKLLLTCFYRDTTVTLSSEIPLRMTTCTYRFNLVGKEQTVEQPEIKCQ